MAKGKASKTLKLVLRVEGHAEERTRSKKFYKGKKNNVMNLISIFDLLARERRGFMQHFHNCFKMPIKFTSFVVE